MEGSPAAILLIVLAAVLSGAVLWLVGAHAPADTAWAVAVVFALIPLGISVVRDLLHHRVCAAPVGRHRRRTRDQLLIQTSMSGGEEAAS